MKKRHAKRWEEGWGLVPLSVNRDPMYDGQKEYSRYSKLWNEVYGPNKSHSPVKGGKRPWCKHCRNIEKYGQVYEDTCMNCSAPVKINGFFREVQGIPAFGAVHTAETDCTQPL